MSLKFSTHLIILKRSTPSVSKYRHSQSHSQSHILYTPSHRISTLSIRLKISTLSKCLHSRPFSKYVYRQSQNLYTLDQSQNLYILCLYISTLSTILKICALSVSKSLPSQSRHIRTSRPGLISWLAVTYKKRSSLKMVFCWHDHTSSSCPRSRVCSANCPKMARCTAKSYIHRMCWPLAFN